MSHHNAPSIFFTPMRETSGRTTRSTFARNMNTTSPRHSIAIDEDNNIGVKNMLEDSQALMTLASSNLSRKRQRNKLFIDENLKAIQVATLSLKEFFRLTNTQEVAIQKCFQLIKENFSTILRNKLAKLLTLEVLENTSSLQSQMREFVLAKQEIVLVKEDEGVAHTNIYRVIG
jgi:hypothetical protein